MISCRKCYSALAAGQTANWDQQWSRGRTGVKQGGNEPQALPQGFWPRTGQAQAQGCSAAETRGCAQKPGCSSTGVLGCRDVWAQRCSTAGVLRWVCRGPQHSTVQQLWLMGCDDQQPLPAAPPRRDPVHHSLG